jgi:hypothetical protein
MKSLDLIVGSGGVLSHAPRRHQAARMLIDSFLPEGITQIAVDSIFMMPQLGVLSTVHPKAAVEVFDKDCMIRLGTCIAPVGETKKGSTLMHYEIELPNEKISGKLVSGEIKLIEAPYEAIKATLTPSKGIDIGNGINEIIKTNVFGGVVGLILDGRGRAPFMISNDNVMRIQQLSSWAHNTQEFPMENK